MNKIDNNENANKWQKNINNMHTRLTKPNKEPLTLEVKICCLRARGDIIDKAPLRRGSNR